jgi:hypothetical protein
MMAAGRRAGNRENPTIGPRRIGGTPWVLREFLSPTLKIAPLGVRSGRSAVLVVRREAGAGKTALLDYAVESVPELRTVRAAGVESEMELAFAMEAGPAPDRFLVGLAVLSLLSEVAGDRPLLCVVDDVQWLNRVSVQVLAFAARRLLAEAVLVIFAAREPGGPVASCWPPGRTCASAGLIRRQAISPRRRPATSSQRTGS